MHRVQYGRVALIHRGNAPPRLRLPVSHAIPHHLCWRSISQDTTPRIPTGIVFQFPGMWIYHLRLLKAEPYFFVQLSRNKSQRQTYGQRFLARCRDGRTQTVISHPKCPYLRTVCSCAHSAFIRTCDRSTPKGVKLH